MPQHIVWEPKYSVKIAQFDEQHQQLIEMINRLYDTLDTSDENAAANEVFVALAHYTQTHFTAEEKLFEKHGYPQYLEHKQLHDIFVEKMHQIIKEMLSGKRLSAMEVLTILKDWLTNHILKEDMKYSDFLLSKGIS